MPHRIVALGHGVAFAVLALQPVTAQEGPTSARWGWSAEPVRQAIDGHTGSPLGAVRFPDFSAQGDYSVSSMFSQLHGDFMQNVERFRPQARFSAGVQAETELDGEAGEFSFTEYEFDGEFDFPVDPDTFVTIGGLYRLRDYQFDGTPGVADEEVHAIGLTVGVGHFLREDLLLTAKFQPGLRSDLSGTLTREDWSFYGEALATWQLDANHRTFAKIGVAVDETFEDVPVYPLAGLTHVVSENFRVDVLFPRYAQLAWIPSAELIVSGGVELEGDEYAVRRRVAGGGRRQFDFRTQELRLFLDTTWRFDDHTSIHGRIGSTLAGHYDIETAAGDDFDGSVDPALFLEVGFGFSF